MHELKFIGLDFEPTARAAKRFVSNIKNIPDLDYDEDGIEWKIKDPEKEKLLGELTADETVSESSM